MVLGPWARHCVVGCMCVALIGGCTANPYVEPTYPRPGLARKVDQGVLVVDRDRDQQPITRHVSVSQAREYGRALQDAYRAAAASESQQRQLADFGVIGSAATALGIVATGGHGKTASALGISAGGLSVLADRYLDATRRKIYFQGALALECVIGITSANPTFNVEVIGVSSTMPEIYQAAEDLRVAKETLVQNLKNEDPKGGLFEDVRKAEMALTRSDIILRGSRELLDALDPLGQIVLSKIEEIRIRVDSEVAKREPDLLDYNEALKGVLASTPSGFTTPQITAPSIPDEIPYSSAETIHDLHSYLTIPHQEMVNKSNRLHESLSSFLSRISALSRNPESISLNFFDKCALTDSIGIGPLRLSESVVKFPAETEASIHLRVIGGSPPYSHDKNVLDSQIKVKKTAITADGTTFIIHVPKEKASGRILLPVSDSTGNTRNLVITFERTPPAAEQ